MLVWVVQYDCQDYYCDAEHLAGVYSTEALAHAAIATHKAIPRHRTDFREWNRYDFACFPVEVDQHQEESARRAVAD